MFNFFIGERKSSTSWEKQTIKVDTNIHWEFQVDIAALVTETEGPLGAEEIQGRRIPVDYTGHAAPGF